MPPIPHPGNPGFFSQKSHDMIESKINTNTGDGIISRQDGTPRKFAKGRLTLMLGCALAVGVGLGTLMHRPEDLRRKAGQLRLQLGLGEEDTALVGQWGRIRLGDNDADLTPYQIHERERLRSLGYAGGSVPASGDGGVTVQVEGRASSALRYYTSGHGPVAFLMKASGQVLHRWQYSYQQLLREAHPDQKFLPDTEGATDCWRRARLLPGGEMLAIFEGHGLVKLDRDSHLLWSFAGGCHHDLDLAPNGDVLVLTRETAVVPRIHPSQPVLLDFITRLSPTGQLLDRIDILAAFEKSIYAGCLDRTATSGDILHTNTLERLDGSLAHLGPAFAEGNYLISVRQLDTVAIVDGRTGLVVWALSGLWVAQHQPTFLNNGHLLVFDNKGHRGHSKVLECDPLTQEVIWVYGDSPAHPLSSPTCGSCQALPSGHVLITESDNGRVLEVDRQGLIVWEFRNPRRAGPDSEFIAAIMEMVLLPEDYRPAWLDLP